MRETRCPTYILATISTLLSLVWLFCGVVVCFLGPTGTSITPTFIGLGLLGVLVASGLRWNEKRMNTLEDTIRA